MVIRTRRGAPMLMVPSHVPTNWGATAGLAFGKSTFASPVRVNFSGSDCGPWVKVPSRVLPSAESVPFQLGSPGPPLRLNAAFPSVSEILSSGIPTAPWAGIETDPIHPSAVLSRSTSKTSAPTGESMVPLQWPFMSVCADSAPAHAIHRHTAAAVLFMNPLTSRNGPTFPDLLGQGEVNVDCR